MHAGITRKKELPPERGRKGTPTSKYIWIVIFRGILFVRVKRQLICILAFVISFRRLCNVRIGLIMLRTKTMYAGKMDCLKTVSV